MFRPNITNNFYFYPPCEKPQTSGNEMEYVKLWMEQSKLMWSRCQFINFIHVAILGGWGSLYANKFPVFLQVLLLSLGIILSIPLLVIVQRDGNYMKKLIDHAGDAFVHSDCQLPLGRYCIYSLIATLMIAEVIVIGLLLSNAL